MVKEIRYDPTLPDIYYRQAKAGARYAMFRGTYLVSEFGSFDADYVSTRFSTKNGRYTSYGLEYKPTRRVDITVIGGPDYKSANVELNPTPRTSLHGFWQDNRFGLGFGNKANVAFSLKLRHVTWRLTYSDSVTSIQELLLDPNASNANLQTFQVVDSLFRQKQSSLSVNRRGKRIEAGMKFFVDKRLYDITQVNSPASVAGSEFNMTWHVDGRLDMVANTHNEYRKTEADLDAGRLDFFSVGVQLAKRRNVNAGLSYRYTSQSDPLFNGGSYVENSILVTASFTR